MGEPFDDKLKLYVRLPVKIKEELEVKDLHGEIVRVWLPRQKSRRWCIVGVASADSLKRVRRELRARRIDGRKVVVGPFKRPDGKRRSQRHAADVVSAESLLQIVAGQ